MLDPLLATATVILKELLRPIARAECHLFVWLDGTQPGAELAVAKMPPPPAPEIPSEIDVVWLATPPLATPEKLWRARPSAGWEVLR